MSSRTDKTQKMFILNLKRQTVGKALYIRTRVRGIKNTPLASPLQ